MRLNPRYMAGVGFLIVYLAGAAGAKPPVLVLPTPCLAGNCGNSAQSFVTYGAAGAAVSARSVAPGGSGSGRCTCIHCSALAEPAVPKPAS